MEVPVHARPYDSYRDLYQHVWPTSEFSLAHAASDYQFNPHPAAYGHPYRHYSHAYSNRIPNAPTRKESPPKKEQ